jgi:SOS-response transcriptional repressor LexA
VIFEDRPWEPNQVVHAFSGGEDTVKVVRRKGATVELAPINEGFPILPGAGVNIKGVAVARIRIGAQGEKTTTEYPFGIRHIPNTV